MACHAGSVGAGAEAVGPPVQVCQTRALTVLAGGSGAKPMSSITGPYHWEPPLAEVVLWVELAVSPNSMTTVVESRLGDIRRLTGSVT